MREWQGVDTDTRRGPRAAPALGLLAMSWRMGRARFEPSLICFIAFRSTVYAYRFSRIDAGAFPRRSGGVQPPEGKRRKNTCCWREKLN